MPPLAKKPAANIEAGDTKNMKVLETVHGKSCDEKIELFRKAVVEQRGKVDASKLLRQYFTDS